MWDVIDSMQTKEELNPTEECFIDDFLKAIKYIISPLHNALKRHFFSHNMDNRLGCLFYAHSIKQIKKSIQISQE